MNENDKVYEWEVLESDDTEHSDETDETKKEKWDIYCARVIAFNVKPRTIIYRVALRNADKWEAIEMKVKKIYRLEIHGQVRTWLITISECMIENR